MKPFLDSIALNNFRSIEGAITIPLNAPVVILHGANGAGKTSVLSAIELALTGEVSSMLRSDAAYRSHLLHRGSSKGSVVLNATVPRSGTVQKEISITSGGTAGTPLLENGLKQFFSERCYLAQSTLGKLLEIYQVSSGDEDSALTRFVKDLLGLDAMEALIDGLYQASDARNTRRLSPEFRHIEAELSEIKSRVAVSKDKLTQATEEAARKRAAFSEALAELKLPVSTAAIPQPGADSISGELEEAEIVRLSALNLDLASIKRRAAQLRSSSMAATEDAAVAEETAASNARLQWFQQTGQAIEALISNLRAYFPDLPSMSDVDPETAMTTASEHVQREMIRCEKAITEDDTLVQRLQLTLQTIEQSKSRIAIDDEQIATITRDAEQVSRAIASVIPHIHGNTCPVCDRDFSEVSADLLAQHVSSKVANLTEQANRLQGLARDRLNAIHILAGAERERDAASAKRLQQEARTNYKSRIAELTEAKRQLAGTSAAAKAGAAIIKRQMEARKVLGDIRGRNTLIGELRTAANKLRKDLSE